MQVCVVNLPATTTTIKNCVTYVWFLRLAASKSSFYSVKYMNGWNFFFIFCLQFFLPLFFHNGTWIKQKRAVQRFFHACTIVICVVEWMKHNEQITISMHDIKRQVVFLIVHIALCVEWSWFFFMFFKLLVHFFIIGKYFWCSHFIINWWFPRLTQNNFVKIYPCQEFCSTSSTYFCPTLFYLNDCIKHKVVFVEIVKYISARHIDLRNNNKNVCFSFSFPL